MANKKADFKLDDMEVIKRQANVKDCWFDDKEGLFQGSESKKVRNALRQIESNLNDNLHFKEV